MKDFLYMIQTCFAAVGGWLGWFLGGMDGLILTLVIFMAVDYISGVLVAISRHKLNSNVGFKGIAKKFLIVALVGIGSLIDRYVITDGAVIRTAIIFFYLSNEGISILENAGKLGLRIPQKLKQILEQIEGDEDEH